MTSTYQRGLYLLALFGWSTALLTTWLLVRSIGQAEQLDERHRRELLSLRAAMDGLRRDALAGVDDLPRIPPTQLPTR
jgi:hypothetical protein